MFQEGNEVLEGIAAVKFGGVDHGHKEVADEGAIWGLEEERVFPVQDWLL